MEEFCGERAVQTEKGRFKKIGLIIVCGIIIIYLYSKKNQVAVCVCVCVVCVGKNKSPDTDI